MKYITKRIKIHFLLAVAAMMFILSSCNKAVEQFAVPAVVAPTGLALGETIATIADDSLYYKLIVRGGMLATINNKSTIFTMFVPNNAAMRQFLVALGAPGGQPDPVYVGFINTFIPATTAASIVSYNMIPQAITMASVPGTFPNWFYPTHLNPTTGTPAFNPLVRFTTSPSTRNGNWVNNIPLNPVNATAANGIIHTALAMPALPQRAMWERINTDANLTYLKVAVQRADSGVAPTTSASLIWVLSNFGPNVTMYAPIDAAFQALIFGLVYQQVFAATGSIAAATAAANGAVAAGPAFLMTNNVSTLLVKGIVVYHMMGYRVFTNNFPTTATSYPTLLNQGVPVHPGVSLVCTFAGLSVNAASVKGIANATASNIAINPTPDGLPSYGVTPPPPFIYTGTSDQHYFNGTLHKINQVLLPQ